MWIDDQILQHAAEPVHIACWIPEQPVVVLGSSNKAELELNRDHCLEDHVKVYRRYGGGGAVVLHRGCVIVSIGMWVRELFENQRYFTLLNELLIQALAKEWPLLKDLRQRGISDIVWQDRKIAGTSLFRSRNYLLYQASILVQDDIPLINRYLAHPSKEPDYRGKRDHGSFLTSLAAIIGSVLPEHILSACQTYLPLLLPQHLGVEQVPVQSEQLANIAERVARSAREKDRVL